jgi:hypothetical protein
LQYADRSTEIHITDEPERIRDEGDTLEDEIANVPTFQE